MVASFFGSPAPFLSHPLTSTTTHHRIWSSSSQTPPPPLSPPQPPAPQSSVPVGAENQQQKPIKPAANASTSSSTSVESTDWIASTLTRRFGLGAGLAWVGFLAIGVISEQIKTRLEVSQQAANTKDVEVEEEVILPNGIRYYDLRVGGGASPRSGDLVVINVKGIVRDNGQVFVDTFGGDDKKPLVLVLGSRPYNNGVCDGVEYVLRSMQAGGKRRAIIPPSLGFGEKGADLGSALQVPPSATLEYIIEVDKVSSAPS